MPFSQHAAGDADQRRLEFKYYQAVETVLSVPEGAVIKAAQACLQEPGKVRVQQARKL